MRRALAAALGAVLLAGASPAAASGMTIRGVDTEGFPRVALTVSFEEETEISLADVRVAENGAPAEVTAVEALGDSGRTVDVVLAMDVSGSMEGRPLAAAVAAAKEFVGGLPDGVRVGVLTFSDDALTAQRLTDDRAGALRAIDGLVARGETALYDGVIAAARMFGGVGQANMVLLSDGGDTASRGTLGDAVAAARHAGAAVFPVGLQSPETDVAALRNLASRTDGRYAPADAADLTAIYESLATELSNQYVITYRSARPHGSEIDVSVATPSGSDSSLFAAPDAETGPAPGGPASPAAVPEPEPLLRGAWGMAVAVGLTFAAVFVLLTMILGADARRRRARELARRLAQPRRAEEGAPDPDSEGRSAWIPERLAAVAERATPPRFAERLDRKLERAGMPLRAAEFTVLTAGAVLVGGVAGAVVGGLLFVVVLAAVAGSIPAVLLRWVLRKRTDRMHEQLPDVLMLLSSSLRAGHSFLQALDAVAQEIGDPGAVEFSRVVAEIRLGRPIDDALNDMADRVGSEDFKWAIIAVNIQREVGGNLAEVLDTVARLLREREVVRRQVRVLSAEGRLSAWILTALPALIALYIAKVNPGYLDTLITTRVGIMMLAVSGSLMVLGVLWMRKLVKIDV